MATFNNNLRIKEIATGAEAGSWGTSTNTNLSLIGDAFGYATEATFNTDANKSVTIGDATTSPYRSMYVKVTSSTTLSTSRDLTIGPNTIKRVMFLENSTTGGQAIVIKQGSGSSVSIPNGSVMCVYLDGAGAGAAVVSVFTDFVSKNSIVQDSLKVTGTNPTFTLGDGGAEDVKILFDGNAQDYYLGVDDTDDILKIGLGSTVGTSSALVVNSNGNVGVNEDQPGLAKLQVKSGDAGSITLNSGANELLIESSSDCGISIMQPNDASGRICFGDPDNNDAGEIRYDHDGAGGFVHTSESSFRFKSGSTTLADIEADGDFKLHVASKGIILKSPNGTSYRVTVDNSGNLSTASV